MEVVVAGEQFSEAGTEGGSSLRAKTDAACLGSLISRDLPPEQPKNNSPREFRHSYFAGNSAKTGRASTPSFFPNHLVE